MGVSVSRVALVVCAGIAWRPSARVGRRLDAAARQRPVVDDADAARRRAYLEFGRCSNPALQQIELQALIEYGLTDRLTAIVYPGLQHIDIASPTGARTGLGYTEFGGRYRFQIGRAGCFPARRRRGYRARWTRPIRRPSAIPASKPIFACCSAQLSPSTACRLSSTWNSGSACAPAACQ